MSSEEGCGGQEGEFPPSSRDSRGVRNPHPPPSKASYTQHSSTLLRAGQAVATPQRQTSSSSSTRSSRPPSAPSHLHGNNNYSSSSGHGGDQHPPAPASSSSSSALLSGGLNFRHAMMGRGGVPRPASASVAEEMSRHLLHGAENNRAKWDKMSPIRRRVECGAGGSRPASALTIDGNDSDGGGHRFGLSTPAGGAAPFGSSTASLPHKGSSAPPTAAASTTDLLNSSGGVGGMSNSIETNLSSEPISLGATMPGTDNLSTAMQIITQMSLRSFQSPRAHDGGDQGESDSSDFSPKQINNNNNNQNDTGGRFKREGGAISRAEQVNKLKAAAERVSVMLKQRGGGGRDDTGGEAMSRDASQAPSSYCPSPRRQTAMPQGDAAASLTYGDTDADADVPPSPAPRSQTPGRTAFNFSQSFATSTTNSSAEEGSTASRHGGAGQRSHGRGGSGGRLEQNPNASILVRSGDKPRSIQPKYCTPTASSAKRRFARKSKAVSPRPGSIPPPPALSLGPERPSHNTDSTKNFMFFPRNPLEVIYRVNYGESKQERVEAARLRRIPKQITTRKGKSTWRDPNEVRAAARWRFKRQTDKNSETEEQFSSSLLEEEEEGDGETEAGQGGRTSGSSSPSSSPRHFNAQGGHPVSPRNHRRHKKSDSRLKGGRKRAGEAEEEEDDHRAGGGTLLGSVVKISSEPAFEASGTMKHNSSGGMLRSNDPSSSSFTIKPVPSLSALVKGGEFRDALTRELPQYSPRGTKRVNAETRRVLTQVRAALQRLHGNARNQMRHLNHRIDDACQAIRLLRADIAERENYNEVLRRLRWELHVEKQRRKRLLQMVLFTRNSLHMYKKEREARLAAEVEFCAEHQHPCIFTNKIEASFAGGKLSAHRRLVQSLKELNQRAEELAKDISRTKMERRLVVANGIASNRHATTGSGGSNECNATRSVKFRSSIGDMVINMLDEANDATMATTAAGGAAVTTFPIFELVRNAKGSGPDQVWYIEDELRRNDVQERDLYRALEGIQRRIRKKREEVIDLELRKRRRDKFEETREMQRVERQLFRSESAAEVHAASASHRRPSAQAGGGSGLYNNPFQRRHSGFLSLDSGGDRGERGGKREEGRKGSADNYRGLGPWGDRQNTFITEVF